MRERNLGVGLRLLLGLLGAIAVGAGGAVAARQLRIAFAGWPNWLAAATAVFGAVIVLGGIRLLRGAVRGRIVVRRNG